MSQVKTVTPSFTEDQKRFLAVLYVRCPHDGSHEVKWLPHIAEMNMTVETSKPLFQRLKEMGAFDGGGGYLWWTNDGHRWAHECYNEFEQRKQRTLSRNTWAWFILTLLGGLLLAWLVYYFGWN